MTSPTPQQLSQSGSLDELYGQLGTDPRRRRLGQEDAVAVAGAEEARSRPHVWIYAQAKGALDAAGRLINTELAERRNLVLHNPAEGYATSRTIVAAYQMIMPGEKARSHRHTPNALRLISTPSPAPTPSSTASGWR